VRVWSASSQRSRAGGVDVEGPGGVASPGAAIGVETPILCVENVVGDTTGGSEDVDGSAGP
jgi:hypothetical protein